MPQTKPLLGAEVIRLLYDNAVEDARARNVFGKDAERLAQQFATELLRQNLADNGMNELVPYAEALAEACVRGGDMATHKIMMERIDYAWRSHRSELERYAEDFYRPRKQGR